MYLPSFEPTTKSTTNSTLKSTPKSNAGWLDRFEIDDFEQTNVNLNEDLDQNSATNGLHSIDQTENQDVLSRQTRKSGYATISAKYNFDEAQMAQMFLLTAASLSFDFRSVRTKAAHNGVVADIVPLDEHWADNICDVHKNDRDGYARYESKLIQGASKIVDFVHEVNADCNEDNFPSDLGHDNLVKFCKIFAPASQCQYYHEIRRQLGCRKLAVNWSRDVVQIVLTIKLPYHDGQYENEGNPKYYHVKAMSNYHFWGYLRSKIQIPDDLILENRDNGMARVFTGCFRGESTSNIWKCQSSKNTHSEYSNCIINIFNGLNGNCQGN